jgi:multidrug transporter EmrE-like cation transporter
MSIGTHRLGHASVVSLLASPAGWLQLIGNIPLLIGYSLYGLSAVLLVLALRDAELSILYPIIALTYVWVAILSWALLHEQIQPARVFGIALIIVGVAVLGRGGQR